MIKTKSPRRLAEFIDERISIISKELEVQKRIWKPLSVYAGYHGLDE